LPAVITDALFEERRELAEVIDNMSGLNDVRSGAGAFGILSRNLIIRSGSFKLAVISALTPFFNKEYYYTAALSNRSRKL
jgi:non-canonical (house-cleaning) NTP pyrophosphatase